MTISHTFDDENGVYVLVVSDGRLSNSPAGPRLFRAPPHPDIQFEHATEAGAIDDAARLRTYLAQLSTKRQTKKELRERVA